MCASASSSSSLCLLGALASSLSDQFYISLSMKGLTLMLRRLETNVMLLLLLQVSVFDSITQGGDGVWEGLRIYNGKVFKLDEHLDRYVFTNLRYY